MLSAAEQADFERIQREDELPANEYDVVLGGKSGHWFASNGFSMVRDLTTARNIDADTVAEADEIVATA